MVSGAAAIRGWFCWLSGKGCAGQGRNRAPARGETLAADLTKDFLMQRCRLRGKAVAADRPFRGAVCAQVDRPRVPTAMDGMAR